MNGPTESTFLCDNDSTIGLNGAIQSKYEYQFSSAPRDVSAVASQSSQVTAATRIGVLCFQGNDIIISQEYFLAALQHLNNTRQDPPSSIQGCSASLPSPLKEQLPRSSDSTRQQYQKRPLPSSNVSFSEECDEGLHAIREVVMFHDDDADFESMAAAIHYNIAQTHLASESYQEAMFWFCRSLERYTSFQSSLPMKYKVLHNLGCCSYKMEDSNAAMEYFNQACEVLTVLGLDDDRIATCTYNCIGVVFFNLATPDTESALKAFQMSFEIYQSNPTSFKSTELATLFNNFGRVFYLMGDFEKAIDVYQQALVLRRQNLGDRAIDVAATCYNLGNAFHKIRDLKHAMSCYDEFLHIAETCLRLESQEVAFVYKCKAEILQEGNNVASALKHYNKALSVAKAALGEGHREVGCILNKAGNLCFEQGHYQEALRFYVWGLDIENSQPNRDQNLILVTLTNIAQTHKHLGRIELALAFYREVYDVQCKVKSTDKLEVASTLSSIGLMLYHLKHYEEAFEMYQRALLIRRDYHKTDQNADVASSLNAIGLVLFKQGMYELCMRCFNECLETRRKIFGPDHSEMAMVWYNLASVSFETGDDEVALQRYEEALRIERKTLGDHHPDIVLTMIHLGQVKQQCGLLDGAVAVFEEAIRLHRLQGSDDGLREARIYNFIGNCFLQQGNVPKMMEWLSNASRILMRLGCADEPLAIKGYNLYGLSRLHPEAAPTA